MVIGTKRRPPTWQQALLLIIFGLILGYPSGIGVGNAMWGTGRYPGLSLLGFFASAVSFISGFAIFLSIAIRAVTSSTGTVPNAVLAPLSPYPTPKQGVFPRNVATALLLLRVSLVAIMGCACFVLLRWGGPRLTSTYGRSYWLTALLTFVLTQLPYLVALIRIWKVPDLAGLGLAMAAGAIQVLATTFLEDKRQTPEQLWVSASLSLAVVALAYFSWWRSSTSRKSDGGLLMSILFGFIAYTMLTQIALGILRAHLRA